MNKIENRLYSLDVFRGITIVGMILVNNPGSWDYVYRPLLHAKWNGWTPTDFIFPFFLFIVGVAMAFSFSKRIEQGSGFKQLFLKVIRRTLIIFILGLFLNYYWSFDLATLRIPGVLQRIAICYFFASLFMLKMNQRWQIVLAILLLAVYWAALKIIPVPGFGAGNLSPEGNLCRYVDSQILSGHTWLYAPALGFDPEGILSTIPAIVSVLLGVFTGNWLRSSKEKMEKAAGMFFIANIALVLGVIMHEWLPINKNLWTSSYVIFMAGMALHFLGFCYWLIDVKGYKNWAFPFTVFGMNAIIAYFTLSLFGKTMAYWKITQSDGSEISIKSILYENIFAPAFGDYFGSLMYPITMIVIWFGLLFLLYRKRIFIKV